MDDLDPAMRDLFLGGEDEEWQDFSPPSARQGPRGGVDVAFLEIHVADNEDGSATVTYYTNDADYDGVPDQHGPTWNDNVTSWIEQWPSADEALQQLGPSRVDQNGRIVSVLRNGVPVG